MFHVNNYKNRQVEWTAPGSQQMEKTKRVLHSCNRKLGLFSEKLNNVVGLEAKSEPDFSPSGSGPVDSALGTDYKSERIADLEKTMSRLKNALVSLEEDNLRLNKKIRGSKEEDRKSLTNVNVLGSTSGNNSQEMGSDNSPTSRINAHSVTLNIAQTSPGIRDMSKMEERCIFLEKERQDLQAKLCRMKDYCKVCAHELKRILPRYKDLKDSNKILDERNKKLSAENRRLVHSLETAGQSEDKSRDLSQARNQKKRVGRNGAWARQEEVNEQCAQLTQEKGHLEAREASLAKDVSHLTGEPEVSRDDVLQERRRPLEGSTPRGLSPPALPGSRQPARLEEENETLRGDLRRSVERCSEAEGRAKRLREKQAILEGCFFTLRKEKDLLQLEVRRLHREYLALSASVAIQLSGRSNTTRVLAGSLKVSGISDGGGARQQENPRQPLHSSPVTRGTPHHPVGREAIDQIRKRFEEEELKKAQRYSSVISQSE
ncbi:uncharacterized protein si:dkey-256e7.8 isoform X2 [Esox lucius]|uniref:uncharacterized protein si:dkey-256e7.8 isoform X2 n=1 Tax=Esox lucius TaxID=8010 RepID=UPI001476A31A|nr:uncharacterized protein si:dkey-256e7.8 isoform X2 [Esox lucius]